MGGKTYSVRGSLRSGAIVVTAFTALLIMLLAMLAISGAALAQSNDGDPASGPELTTPTVTPPETTGPETTTPLTTSPEPPAHACGGDCGAGLGDKATEEVGSGVGAEGNSGIGAQSPDDGSGATNVRSGGGSDEVNGRQAYNAALGAARSTGAPGGDVASPSKNASNVSTEDATGAAGDASSGTRTGSGGQEATTGMDEASGESGSTTNTTEAATNEAGSAGSVATVQDSRPFYYLPGTVALLVGGIFVARRMFLRR